MTDKMFLMRNRPEVCPTGWCECFTCKHRQGVYCVYESQIDGVKKFGEEIAGLIRQAYISGYNAHCNGEVWEQEDGSVQLPERLILIDTLQILSTKLNGITLQELLEFYFKVKEGEALMVGKLEGELPENPVYDVYPESELNEMRLARGRGITQGHQDMLKANYKQVVAMLGEEG